MSPKIPPPRHGDEALRRLLAAAAAREGEVPRLDPFFMARLRARLRAKHPSSALAAFALATRSLAVPLLLVVLGASGWAGWQSWESGRRLQTALAHPGGGLAERWLAELLGELAPPQGEARP